MDISYILFYKISFFVILANAKFGFCDRYYDYKCHTVSQKGNVNEVGKQTSFDCTIRGSGKDVYLNGLTWELTKRDGSDAEILAEMTYDFYRNSGVTDVTDSSRIEVTFNSDTESSVSISTITLKNISLADDGVYHCVVTAMISPCVAHSGFQKPRENVTFTVTSKCLQSYI